MLKASGGRVLLAVVGSYLAFGLAVAATGRMISPLAIGRTNHRAYFLADVFAQCLFLIAAGHLCSALARSSHRLAIVLVGSFRLATSWKSKPHGYGIALLPLVPIRPSVESQILGKVGGN